MSETRFIVVSPPRSGSTVLRRTLNLHADIVCKGEVYAINRVIGANRREAAEALRRRRDQPVEFLRQVAFEPGLISGFKLLYPQLADVGFMTTLSLIREDPSIRIVHLWREDLCHRFISERRLHLQVAPGSEQREEVRCSPSPREMLHDCRNQQLMRARVRQLFKHHETLDVAFERLREALPQVQRFLGVRGPAFKLPREKQDYVSDVTVVIENEQELERSYANWVRERQEARQRAS